MHISETHSTGIESPLKATPCVLTVNLPRWWLSLHWYRVFLESDWADHGDWTFLPHQDIFCRLSIISSSLNRIKSHFSFSNVMFRKLADLMFLGQLIGATICHFTRIDLKSSTYPASLRFTCGRNRYLKQESDFRASMTWTAHDTELSWRLGSTNDGALGSKHGCKDEGSTSGMTWIYRELICMKRLEIKSLRVAAE